MRKYERMVGQSHQSESVRIIIIKIVLRGWSWWTHLDNINNVCWTPQLQQLQQLQTEDG